MKQPVLTSDDDDVPVLDPARLYTEDGVDWTLIEMMLRLTPAERLELLQRQARSLLRMRRAATRL